MSVPPAAAVAKGAATASPAYSVVATWRESSREKKVGVMVLLALGLWSLYRYFRSTSDSAKPSGGSGEDVAPKPLDKLPSSDDREGSITSDAAADLRVAAPCYGKEYQDRMKATTAVPTAASKARPFIGFSLADNIVAGALVVDGVFVGGPADQTGVDIDHRLVSINNEPATSIDEVRELVAKHCRPGQVTRMRLCKEDDGPEYEVPLWVMTTDEKFEDKPYFFDTKVHEVRQSERLKQTWRRSESPN
ncbi:PDZ domain containing protein [Lotmaria passim]